MILQKKIGIIGGGQLGKMMILDAKRLGYYVITLDPTENCPSHSISDEHIVAAFDDYEAIKTLAVKTDVITYEFEHIGVEVLKNIESQGFEIYPKPSSLEIIQDKFTQKTVLFNNNILIPGFKSVKSIDEIKTIGESFKYPMMLKTCTGGYDGKGNALIETEEDIEEAFHKLGAGCIPLMVEEFVPFEKEISVLACRSIKGDIEIYPVAENYHKNSILDETIVPANISEKTAEKAMTLAHDVLEVFEDVGMYCIEMFVCKDEEIYINEIAPRPHNSGHYTIEGCFTSQFEQHIRAIVGLPLGSTQLIMPTVMKNIIGDPLENGKAVVNGAEKALAVENTKLHIYGKEEVKPYRKMGHITTCHENQETALNLVRLAHESIHIAGQ